MNKHKVSVLVFDESEKKSIVIFSFSVVVSGVSEEEIIKLINTFGRQLSSLGTLPLITPDKEDGHG